MTRFSRIDMDAVAPLLPGDRVAARVSGRGEHFELNSLAPGKIHSAMPLATRAPTNVEKLLSNFVDLTGATIGRFKVLGIAVDITSTTGQCWVVRCVCGSYETRKAKYIKACVAGNNLGDTEPMCDWCNKTQKLRRGSGIKYDGPLIKIEGYK